MNALVIATVVAALATDARRTPVVAAVERATPSVVSLEVEVVQSSGFPFFAAAPANSQGSGVVIDATGLVLTNAHVVQGARSITAHLGDNRKVSADLIALDEELDLAVLQLANAGLLTPITIADSDALMLGETTVAIGNPLGLGLTVSTGVVSSVRRDVEIRPGISQAYIQTDAAINPGNSGGALVDLNGHLIGINTAIRADAQGIGFAIPANRARKIAEDLLSYGSVRAPWLGVDLDDVSRRALDGTPYARGATIVTAVYPGGPADKAGLKLGDVIVRADDRLVSSRADLNSWLAEKRPGATVSITYLRGSATARTAGVVSALVPDGAGQSTIQRGLGIAVRPVPGGLVITEASPTGAWTRARLQVGDAIIAVDGQRVTDEAALADRFTQARARHRSTALVTVQRGNARGHVTLPLNP